MAGKSDEAKMAKLIKQNMAKAEAKKPKDTKRRQYDPTLRPEAVDDNDLDRKSFFSEMKKREF
jgi:hypothetical protein